MNLGLIASKLGAISVKNPMFAGSEQQITALAQLYTEVFNNVPDVKEKWTVKTSRTLLLDRLNRPGSLIVLIDLEDRNKLVGGFFARIVPGVNGFDLTEPDVLVAPEFRGNGLSYFLGHLGRTHADKIYSTSRFKEGIQNNRSEIYRVSPFPRSMWESLGYTTQDLFKQNAQDILHREIPSIKGVITRRVQPSDVAPLAKFMSSEETMTFDGSKWTEARAKTYLEHMMQYNPSAMRVAQNGCPVGLVVADTIPRRAGTAIIDVNGFISSKRKDHARIASTLMRDVASAIDTTIATSRRSITDIEIGPQLHEYLSKHDILPRVWTHKS